MLWKVSPVQGNNYLILFQLILFQLGYLKSLFIMGQGLYTNNLSTFRWHGVEFYWLPPPVYLTLSNLIVHFMAWKKIRRRHYLSSCPHSKIRRSHAVFLICPLIGCNPKNCNQAHSYSMMYCAILHTCLCCLQLVSLDSGQLVSQYKPIDWVDIEELKYWRVKYYSINLHGSFAKQYFLFCYWLQTGYTSAYMYIPHAPDMLFPLAFWYGKCLRSLF